MTDAIQHLKEFISDVTQVSSLLDFGAMERAESAIVILEAELEALEATLAAKDEAAQTLIKLAMDASAALDHDKEEVLVGDLYAATEAVKAALSAPTGKETR